MFLSYELSPAAVFAWCAYLHLQRVLCASQHGGQAAKQSGRWSIVNYAPQAGQMLCNVNQFLAATDEAIVLDCGSQIFTRLGLSSADGDSNRHQSQQSAMQALVQQLVHDRLPAPGVLRIDQVGLLLHMRLFMQTASAFAWHTKRCTASVSDWHF